MNTSEIYLFILRYYPNHDFVTFLNFRESTSYIKTTRPRYIVYRDCCSDQYPEDDQIGIVCRSCGFVLSKINIKYELPFRNENSSGHATTNSGVCFVPEPRKYKQITNLKQQYKQYMGWTINAAPTCKKYNMGVKCSQYNLYKCPFSHRCSYCEGSHSATKCKNKSWLKELKFDKNDRQSYTKIRQQLRKLKMPWQYKNIYHIIYKLGGYAPRHSVENQNDIIIALIVIQNYYYDSLNKRSAGVYKKRSLGSAKMLLDSVLKMLKMDPFYRLPSLKNQAANEKVKKFFYSFTKYVSKKFIRCHQSSHILLDKSGIHP